MGVGTESSTSTEQIEDNILGVVIFHHMPRTKL
jgi:hypothetical protein